MNLKKIMAQVLGNRVVIQQKEEVEGNYDKYKPPEGKMQYIPHHDQVVIEPNNHQTISPEERKKMLVSDQERQAMNSLNRWQQQLENSGEEPNGKEEMMKLMNEQFEVLHKKNDALEERLMRRMNESLPIDNKILSIGNAKNELKRTMTKLNMLLGTKGQEEDIDINDPNLDEILRESDLLSLIALYKKARKVDDQIIGYKVAQAMSDKFVGEVMEIIFDLDLYSNNVMDESEKVLDIHNRDKIYLEKMESAVKNIEFIKSKLAAREEIMLEKEEEIKRREIELEAKTAGEDKVEEIKGEVSSIKNMLQELPKVEKDVEQTQQEEPEPLSMRDIDFT